MQVVQFIGRSEHRARQRRWRHGLALLLLCGIGLGVVRMVLASVTLLYFRGTPQSSAVQLTWETASEFGMLGFNVWRREDSSPPGSPPGYQVNQGGVIAARGISGAGATYDLLDNTAVNGTSYWYWLEAVETTGNSEFFENDNNPLVPGGGAAATPTNTPPPGQASATPTSGPPPTNTSLPTNTAVQPQATNTSVGLPPTATLAGPSPTSASAATATRVVPPTFTSPINTPPSAGTAPTFGTPIIPTSIFPPGALSPTAVVPSQATQAATTASNRPTAIVVTRQLPGSSTLSPSLQRTSSAMNARTATAVAAANLPDGALGGPRSVGPGGPDTRRTGIILLGAALLGLIGLGGLGYVFWRWSRPAAPPPAPAPTVLIGPPPSAEPEPPVWEEHDWRRPESRSG
jgi:hypothetical protein